MKLRVNNRILAPATSELGGEALTSSNKQGLLNLLLINKGRGWVGFVCVIVCMVAATWNFALIQALQIHHHSELHGSMGLLSLWDMNILFYAFSAHNMVFNFCFVLLTKCKEWYFVVQSVALHMNVRTSNALCVPCSVMLQYRGENFAFCFNLETDAGILIK